MKNFKKVWGKGGSNLGNIVTKKITGEPLSEHEKTTLRDFRAEVVPVNPQLAIQEQETREAEERAALAEAQAKAAIERTEKLKVELREAQAKLAAEQAEREELELLAQFEQMQMRQKVQIEEHKSPSNGSGSPVISEPVAVDEEMELALALSLSMAVTPKREMEELASKLVAKTIDVNAIRLTQKELSLLEEVCLEQFTTEASSGVKVLLDGLDASLNVIESNILGDI